MTSVFDADSEFIEDVSAAGEPVPVDALTASCPMTGSADSAHDVRLIPHLQRAVLRKNSIRGRIQQPALSFEPPCSPQGQ
jgi:hypothetical protein